jgi:hypothetical protein
MHATAAGERFAVRCSAVAKEFKGKDIEKGVAVPTCISINKQVAAVQAACTPSGSRGRGSPSPARASGSAAYLTLLRLRLAVAAPGTSPRLLTTSPRSRRGTSSRCELQGGVSRAGCRWRPAEDSVQGASPRRRGPTPPVPAANEPFLCPAPLQRPGRTH